MMREQSSLVTWALVISVCVNGTSATSRPPTVRLALSDPDPETLSCDPPLTSAPSHRAECNKLAKSMHMIRGALQHRLATLLIEVWLALACHRTACGSYCSMLTPVDFHVPSARVRRRRRLLHSLLQPSATQSLLVLLVMGFWASVRLPELLPVGARVAHGLDSGEWHRLVTSLLLHTDAVHLVRSCAFGVLRLAPTAAAVFGGLQTLLLFFACGIGANAATHLGRLAGSAPAVGASAALLGLDGALLGASLRDGLSSVDGRGVPVHVALSAALGSVLHAALPRSMISLTLATLQQWGGSARLRGASLVAPTAVDHAAHAWGYGLGVLFGVLLSPQSATAAERLQEHAFARMSRQVAEACGTTSVTAEHAMLSYLHSLPRARRRDALRSWELSPPPLAVHVPATEAWPVVFEGLKAFVAESLSDRPSREDATAGAAKEDGSAQVAGAPAGGDTDEEAAEVATAAAAEAAEVAAREARRQERRHRRLRKRAEEAVWTHFAHRAEVAMPSLRLLRCGQEGLISLQQMRRWRIDVGAIVPAWLAESIAGLLLVWVAISCYDTISRALALSSR